MTANMPTIDFVNAINHSIVSVELAEGGALIDACDRAPSLVPFSCRSTSCGTCRIDILAGEELLEPVDEEELSVLESFNDDPKKRRLACTARIRSVPGVLRIQACEEVL